MTVFKNKQRQGEWRYDFRINGKRFSGPCLSEPDSPAVTKTAARQAEERERVVAQQQQKVAKSGIRTGSYTISQAAALHLARKEGKTDFSNHVRYVREILAFHAFGCGAKAMVDITDEDTEAYRKHAATQTLKKWVGGSRRRKTGTQADAQFWRDTGKARSLREVNNHLKCLRALFAIGERVRDPATRLPVLAEAPEVKLHKMPRRLPRPIGDEELHDRLEVAKPWTREAAELARLFGLRLAEALAVGLHNIDHEICGLRFDAGETKSGNDEFAHGGEAGWQLLLELEAQAIARGQKHLVTWPGPKLWRAMLRGEAVAQGEWRPLKAITRSWRTTGRKAKIVRPHTFHKIRGRYITEIAKVQPVAAQDAARHQDPATTAMYIKLAAGEIRDAVRQANARRPMRRALKLVK
jgi:integrase